MYTIPRQYLYCEQRHQVALYQDCIGSILGASYTIPRQYPYCVQTTFGQYTTYTVALYQHCIGSILDTPYIRYWANLHTVCKRLSHSIGPIHAYIVKEYRYNIVPISHCFLGSAIKCLSPEHNRMLRGGFES